MAGRRSIAGSFAPQVAPVPYLDHKLKIEFEYYCISIRDLISSCPENFRDTYCQWFKLLTIPFNELQQAELREKRNRYLFLLCASLMTKNVEFLLNLSKKKHLSKDSSKKSVKVKGSKEIGREAPKKCSDANGFPISLVDAILPGALFTRDDKDGRYEAQWERQNSWNWYLNKFKEKEGLLMGGMTMRDKAVHQARHLCSMHGTGACPVKIEKAAENVGKCLDNQFEFLVNLASSYIETIATDIYRVRQANSWIIEIAKYNREACMHMKGIRNDYMMILLGYLINGELRGFFEKEPPEILQPLLNAVASHKLDQQVKDKDNITTPLNPAGETIEKFMFEVPSVEEGAFALLCLSGDLLKLKIRQ